MTSLSDIWVADTETTTGPDYDALGHVRVYLWHARSLADDQEAMGTDCSSLIEFFHRNDVKKVWFHNLHFDGMFVSDFILKNGWTPAPLSEKGNPIQVPNERHFSSIITSTGQWMELTLMFGDHICKLCDSFKKLPFSLETIASTYGIPGKTHLESDIFRGDDYLPNGEEITRVKNDTRILRVAMADLYSRDMTALTLSSDGKALFKRLFARSHTGSEKWGALAQSHWDRIFARLSREEDDFIRAAYKGGWTYVNPVHQGHDVGPVFVYDVNSMYPDKMRNRLLPVGRPFARDKPADGELYIVRFTALFVLKPGHFPMVQTKGSFVYSEAHYITSALDNFVQLTLTSIDYELFHEQYDVIEEQDHEYVCFRSMSGEEIYGEYVDMQMANKERATMSGDKPARTVAKLLQNSLYGKTAENPSKKSKTMRLENGHVAFDERTEPYDASKAFYLPHACFITAYARAQAVRTAQAFGPAFVYADTDSVHTLRRAKEGEIHVHETRLGAWKLESVSMKARYLRPKTYMHIMECEVKSAQPFKAKGHSVMEVKAAGAPDLCKECMTWDNFKSGAVFPYKLTNRVVPGGCLLRETTYSIRV